MCMFEIIEKIQTNRECALDCALDVLWMCTDVHWKNPRFFHSPSRTLLAVLGRCPCLSKPVKGF